MIKTTTAWWWCQTDLILETMPRLSPGSIRSNLQMLVKKGNNEDVGDRWRCSSLSSDKYKTQLCDRAILCESWWGAGVMRKVGKLGGNCCRPRCQARTPDGRQNPRCKARTEDLAGMHSSALVGMNGFLISHSISGEKIDTPGEVMNPWGNNRAPLDE